MKKAMRCSDGSFIVIADETNSVIAVMNNYEELIKNFNILGMLKPAMVLTFVVECR